ncbi:hypothetical protein Tco_0410398 [Tanacetum coccineum]
MYTMKSSLPLGLKPEFGALHKTSALITGSCFLFVTHSKFDLLLSELGHWCGDLEKNHSLNRRYTLQDLKLTNLRLVFRGLPNFTGFDLAGSTASLKWLGCPTLKANDWHCRGPAPTVLGQVARLLAVSA